MELTKEEIDGIQIDYIDISPLPMLNTDLEVDGKYPPVVEAFRQRILVADSILFASPEYNYSVTGIKHSTVFLGYQSILGFHVFKFSIIMLWYTHNSSTMFKVVTMNVNFGGLEPLLTFHQKFWKEKLSFDNVEELWVSQGVL